MPEEILLSKQQIGKLGELLVQFSLLSAGIESAPMTTDSGIDLVAYAPKDQKALTIQVKTNLQPKPAGGRGRPTLDWWIPRNSPAQTFAFVDLSQKRIWLFTRTELEERAQQGENKERFHLIMHTDEALRRRKDGKRASAIEFDDLLLNPHRLDSLFYSSISRA